MNLRICTLGLLLCSAAQLYSQEAKYLPVLTDGKMWKLSYNKYTGCSAKDIPDAYMTITVDGDTAVGDMACKKLLVNYGSIVSVTGPEFIVAYEQDGKVWWVGDEKDRNLFIDMNLHKWDIIGDDNCENFVAHEDSVVIGGVRRKRLWIDSGIECPPEVSTYSMVEGIGLSMDLLSPYMGLNGGFYFHRMLACYDNGKCIFTAEDFEKEEETGITDSKADSHAESTTYDLQGRRRSNFSKGEIYVRNRKKYMKR